MIYNNELNTLDFYKTYIIVYMCVFLLLKNSLYKNTSALIITHYYKTNFNL